MGRSKDDDRKRKREDRDKDREKRKKEKALKKLLETPDEKRRRRLEKKEKKAKKRRQKEQESLAGYTNEANPFGDANLTDRFVWKLKREKEIASGKIHPDDFDDAKTERMLRDERLRELEKAKKRRLEREKEREEWEAERDRMARERDGLSYDDWEKQEQTFNLEQAKRRSEIRIQEGRPKPIDILYKNLNMDVLDLDIELNEPYKIFSDLSLRELEELRKDILMYLQLDSHKEFWQSLRIVCDDEIEQLRQREEAEHQARRQGLEASGVHKAVSEDVLAVFRGKTYEDLSRMQSQIMAKITAGNAVDPEYWEGLLARLVVYKAKAKLRDIHAELLRRKLSQLEAGQMLEEARRTVEDQQGQDDEASTTAAGTGLSSGGWDEPEASAGGGGGGEDEDDECLSPELVNETDDVEVVDPELDKQRLEEERQRIMEREAKKLQESNLALTSPAVKLSDAELYQIESERSMDENEETFSTEVALEGKKYWWQDKYRPRKPRYYNRVHTGYEWNKYNQSHYDHDNPPPKTVQGYKFNVFYPDLIDKQKAPRYFIEPSDSPDTCIIRFHAGPPYEDVAFKYVVIYIYSVCVVCVWVCVLWRVCVSYVCRVACMCVCVVRRVVKCANRCLTTIYHHRVVNREWEYSHKRGFKCVFDRGIMHLWFNFKRYRYRR